MCDQQSFQDLNKAVQSICSSRLTSNKPIRRTALPQRDSIQPSGPRAPNEGIDEQEQGIFHAELLQNGNVALYVTMLAAGFVIGQRGFSIRQICEQSNAYIRSETIKPGRFPRTTRLFEISGTQQSCKQALDIIIAAVDLYKKLTEGEMEGQRVEQLQYAANIAFMYQPPPHRMVPQAAQLLQSGPHSWFLRRNQSFQPHASGSMAGAFSGYANIVPQNTSLDEVLMNNTAGATSQLLSNAQFQEMPSLDMTLGNMSASLDVQRSLISSGPNREILGMLNMNTMVQTNQIVNFSSPGSSSNSWRSPELLKIIDEQPNLYNYNRENVQESSPDNMENTVRNILQNLNLGTK